MSQPDAERDEALFRADLIHRAELRRKMLERLSEVGMEMVEEMGRWARDGFSHSQENWVAGFPRVSRAVRLTLVLQARIDAQIIALRKGRWPTGLGAGSGSDARVPSAAPATAVGEPSGAKECDGREARAVEADCERDDFGGLLAAGFDACVAAIRADLGLEADSTAGATPPSTVVGSPAVGVEHRTAASRVNGKVDRPVTGLTWTKPVLLE